MLRTGPHERDRDLTRLHGALAPSWEAGAELGR
jgi:hypothetical protein